eukprot:scaffold3929_cov291-Pinguiococcus_pyrenoidosus.AAC.6
MQTARLGSPDGLRLAAEANSVLPAPPERRNGELPCPLSLARCLLAFVPAVVERNLLAELVPDPGACVGNRLAQTHSRRNALLQMPQGLPITGASADHGVVKSVQNACSRPLGLDVFQGATFPLQQVRHCLHGVRQAAPMRTRRWAECPRRSCVLHRILHSLALLMLGAAGHFRQR